MSSNGFAHDYKLTALDIRRLRNADTITFAYDSRDGTSTIGASIKAENSKSGFEDSQYVPVNSSVTIYDGYNDVVRDKRDVHCFECILYASQSEQWYTVTSALREGDIIVLEWISVTPNTEYKSYQTSMVCTLADYAGMALYHDELRLRVKRGKRDLLFDVTDSITPFNTAKMIRWG